MELPYKKESDADYHARSRSGQVMSSHLLKEFARCPYQYKRIIDGKAGNKDTAAFAVGRAVHCLALEGQEEFDKRFAMDFPINEKTGLPYGGSTKAYSEWKADRQLEGKDTIAPADSRLVLTLAESVRAHEQAQKLLCDGAAEAVVFGSVDGVACQIKIDWYNGKLPAIVDLKTCDDLRFFCYDAKKYDYLSQFAFYQSVVESVIDAIIPVYVIAVEKKEPYRTGVFVVAQADVDLAAEQNANTLRWYQECRESNIWPTGYEQLQDLSV